MIKSIIYKIYR